MRFAEPSEQLDKLAHATIGAALEIHRHLGPGYLEAIYEAALREELTIRRLECQTQFVVPIEYKGRRIGEHRLDLLVGGALVVEIKAVDAMHPSHLAQLLSYLRAGGFQLGLLINFNVPVLREGIRRVIHSR